VAINPGLPETRPRKGTFEVRLGDKVLLSIVGEPRPFPKLKALDMEQVAADVGAALDA